jgi:hypothetical protein
VWNGPPAGLRWISACPEDYLAAVDERPHHRECKGYPASTITFHVNKIPIVAVTEGRGAQDMVALVLRSKIGRIRASHPHIGGNRRWTC